MTFKNQPEAKIIPLTDGLKPRKLEELFQSLKKMDDDLEKHLSQVRNPSASD